MIHRDAKPHRRCHIRGQESPRAPVVRVLHAANLVELVEVRLPRLGSAHPNERREVPQDANLHLSNRKAFARIQCWLASPKWCRYAGNASWRSLVAPNSLPLKFFAEDLNGRTCRHAVTRRGTSKPV